MADASPTQVSYELNSLVVKWEGLGASTSANLSPYTPPPGYALESVQAVGTWNGSAFTLQGANDGVNYLALASDISADGFAFPSGQAVSYGGSVSATTGVDLDVFAFFRFTH